MQDKTKSMDAEAEIKRLRGLLAERDARIAELEGRPNGGEVVEPSPDGVHYLERELYERIKSDSAIFKFIESGSLDGIWYWDLENPEHEWLSPRFREVFGFAADEIPNTPEWWQANIHPADLKVALKNFELHSADPAHPYDQVVRYRHKDGSTVWIRCRGLVIRDPSGKPIRMLGAHTDVTSFKEAEAKLLESNAAFEGFAYAAAHDIRAPLRQIKGFTQLALDRESDLSSATQSNLQRVVDASSRLERMIASIMAYADTMRPAADFEPVNLQSVAQTVCADMEQKIRACDARVTFRYLPWVHGDGGLLYQLVANLLSNAIKYHRPELPPKVEVWSERGAGDPAMCTIFVRDEGIGFDESRAQEMFAPFKRLVGRSEFDGAGIGLATVQRVVDRHGGRVEARSGGKFGATFQVTLPCHRWEDESVGVQHGRGQTTLLLVDDDEGDLALGAQLLVQVFEVLTAPGATQALELMKERAIDIVLTDYQMPDKDGLWLLRKVSKLYPSIRCLLTSGLAPAKMREILADEAVEYFIEKPADAQTLLELLAERRQKQVGD